MSVATQILNGSLTKDLEYIRKLFQIGGISFLTMDHETLTLDYATDAKLVIENNINCGTTKQFLETATKTCSTELSAFFGAEKETAMSTVARCRREYHAAYTTLLEALDRLRKAEKELALSEMKHIPPIEDILTNWIAKFPKGFMTPLAVDTHTLSCVTRPIALHHNGIGIDLGRFLVTINFKKLLDLSVPVESLQDAITVFPFYGNVIAEGNVHPHVSTGGRVCWGEALLEVEGLFKKGDIIGILSLVEAVLCQYNDDSPYTSLQDFVKHAREEGRLGGRSNGVSGESYVHTLLEHLEPLDSYKDFGNVEDEEYMLYVSVTCDHVVNDDEDDYEECGYDIYEEFSSSDGYEEGSKVTIECPNCMSEYRLKLRIVD